MKILALLICLLTTFSTLSREVDNYIAWGVELEDSGPKVDSYLRNGIGKAIVEVNSKKYTYKYVEPRKNRRRKKVIANWYKSCELVAHKVMREAFYSPTYQKIEEFIDTSSSLDTYPRKPSVKDINERQKLGEMPVDGYMTDREYLDRSIVLSSPLNSPLSRIVNVYGIYAGSDKFGHFTSFGVRYLKKMHKSLKKGKSYRESLDKVLHYGHRSEKSYVGMMFTKVFSRGDLEANYQGLVFSSSLCKKDEKVQLVNTNGEWSLEGLEDFTIKDYINPNWDESFNNSLFTEKKWKKAVTTVFKKRNDCEKLNSDFVLSQREFYNSFNSRSLNQEYETEWIKKKFEGISPSKFSLDRFCDLN
jgi:hypothetical protein